MSDVPLAYPVPWLFIREHAPIYGLKNASLEPLRHVWFALIGPGTLPAHLPMTLRPGEVAWFPVTGEDLARSSMLQVRWRRQDESEYLWRAVF